MGKSPLIQSRPIAGGVLVLMAVLMLVFARRSYFTAGAIGLGVLGLLSIAISRTK